LPHKLIEAFKSTLSELQYADLLVHVVDSSAPNWQDQIKIVHEVLAELKVFKEMLYAFNKTDRVADREKFERETEQFAPRVFVSATSKDGLEPLKAVLLQWKKSDSGAA